MKLVWPVAQFQPQYLLHILSTGEIPTREQLDDEQDTVTMHRRYVLQCNTVCSAVFIDGAL